MQMNMFNKLVYVIKVFVALAKDVQNYIQCSHFHFHITLFKKKSFVKDFEMKEVAVVTQYIVS